MRDYISLVTDPSASATAISAGHEQYTVKCDSNGLGIGFGNQFHFCILVK